MSHSHGLFSKSEQKSEKESDFDPYQYFRLSNLISAKIIELDQVEKLTNDQKEVLNHWGISNLLNTYTKLLSLEIALTIPLDKAKRFDCIPILNSVSGGEMTIQQVLDLTNESAASFFGKTLDVMEQEERMHRNQPPSPRRRMS